MAGTRADVTTWRPDYTEDPHPLFADRQVTEPVRRGHPSLTRITGMMPR
jgi:hypothetical protein